MPRKKVIVLFWVFCLRVNKMFQTILFQLLHWKIVLKLKGKISYHENEIKDSCLWGRSSHFIFLQNLVIQNEEYSGKDAGSEGPEWKKIKNVNSLLYNGEFQVATRRCSRQSCGLEGHDWVTNTFTFFLAMRMSVNIFCSLWLTLEVFQENSLCSF